MRTSVIVIGLLVGFGSLTQFGYHKNQSSVLSRLVDYTRETDVARWFIKSPALMQSGSPESVDTRNRSERANSLVGPTITVSGNTNSAIQAAIDAAPSSGATIVIPAGRYTFTGECSMANKSNLTFLGAGSGNTEFYVAPGVNISHILNATGPVNNIRLTGIAFNNQSSATGYGMVFSSEKAPINGYEIDHCSFTAPNLNCNAIKLNPQTYINGVNVSVLVTNLYIHDNRFFSLGRMAIELQNHGWEKGEAPIYQIDGVRVEDNEFTDLGRVDGNNGMAFSVTGPNQNVFVRRNKVTDAKYAAYELVGSRDSEVSDNSARAVNNYYTGISVSDNGHRYTTRLKFLRNDIVVKSNPFQLYGGDYGSVTSWEASNNNFVSSSYSSGDQGSIKLQAASGGTFANNTVRTGGYNAVFLDNAPQNVFTGNTFSNEDNPGNNELINFYNSNTYGNQLVSSNTYKKQSGTVTSGFAVERNGAHDNLFNVIASTVLRNPENPANAVNGLDYSYYEGSWTNLPDFNALTPVKTGISSTPTLSVSNRDNNYALRFTGYVSVPTDGQYTFYTSSDDGSKAFIGSTQLLANDGVHGDQEQSGTIGLKAGLHAVTVLYFQGNGGQSLSMSYSGPGINKQNIPAGSFFRVNNGQTTPPATNLRDPENPANAVTGLNYNYYEGYWTGLPDFNALGVVKSGTTNTPNPTLVRNRTEGFGLKYTGYVSVPTDGNYTFFTSSDDGSKLYIGNTQVVDNDGKHAEQERSGDIGLKAGVHALTIVYYQGDGGQAMSVSYSGPGLNKQNIPDAAYRRVNTGQTTPPPTSNLRNPENPANAMTGLNYNYYEGYWTGLPDFNALGVVKSGTINTPNPTLVRNRTEGFGLKYTGYVSVPTDGNYTFFTSSDDGSKLYIGNTQVVDNDGKHAEQERSGDIGLKAGVHALTIVYYQGDGGQAMSVSYGGPGLNKQYIPDAAYRRINTGQTTPPPTSNLRNPENPANAVTGLNYNYYEGYWTGLPDFNALGVVKSGTINTPNPALVRNRTEGFGLKYTGYVSVPTDGNYTFFTSSDDGSKLYIGNTQVVDNDGKHAEQERSGDIGLKAGVHALTIVYYQGDGGQALSVSYGGPGLNKQYIPDAAYRRVNGAPGRIAAVDDNESLLSMHVYPVPAQEVVWVHYSAKTAGVATIQLISSSAKPALQTLHQVTQGENLLKINVSQLNRGIYLLHLLQDRQHLTRKVLLTE